MDGPEPAATGSEPAATGSEPAATGSEPANNAIIKHDAVSISIEATELKETIQHKTDWKKVRKSLFNVGLWLGFGVGIGLTPVLSSLLVSGAVRQAFSLQNTFGHGALLAISIALMGEAMGYLLTNPNVNSAIKGILGLSCTLILLSSAFLLGVLTISQLTFDTLYITNVSYFLFGMTLIVGSFCKWTER